MPNLLLTLFGIAMALTLAEASVPGVDSLALPFRAEKTNLASACPRLCILADTNNCSSDMAAEAADLKAAAARNGNDFNTIHALADSAETLKGRSKICSMIAGIQRKLNCNDC